MRFDTTEFEFSHRKAPRGFGTWAFSVKGDWRTRDVLKDVVFAPASTYADAKKWARTKFAGRRVVYVCS